MTKNLPDNHFNELCIKLITGNINEDEQKLIKKWLSIAENNEKFERFQKVWEKSRFFEPAAVPDADNAWAELYNRISSAKPRIQKEKFIRLFENLNFRLKPVLVTTFIIILILSGLFLLNRETEPYQFKKILTGNKERKEITLPDGSLVLLNSESSIYYSESFNEIEREIKLTGEGFFTVKKDGRAFVVKTDNARTAVLGTEFNIWARDNKTKVFVKEGKVNLMRNEINSEGVILTKGFSSIIEENLTPSEPAVIDPDYELDWIYGRLNFNKTTLMEIAGELERFYDVEINVEENNLKTMTLTGSFSGQEIDTVLQMITLALNLDYEKQNYVSGQDVKAGYIIKNRKLIN